MTDSIVNFKITAAPKRGAATGCGKPEYPGLPVSPSLLGGCHYFFMEPKTVSKKLRFEVFKRDSFTCKYCGNSAPNVILHVDHIIPKSKGGKNTILNLITSCIDCNLGKGARLLSDTTTLDKQKEQAKLLQIQREQSQMMAEWVNGLESVIDEQIELINEIFLKTTFCLNDKGNSTLRKYIKQYEFQDVVNAAHEIVSWFFRIKDKEGEKQAFEYVFGRYGAVIKGVRLKRIDPDLSKAHYLKNCLKRRFNLPYNDSYIVDALHDMIIEFGQEYTEKCVYECKYKSQATQLIEG